VLERGLKGSDVAVDVPNQAEPHGDPVLGLICS
jgi:hypothetical protein